jgi:hypothetical protein
MGAPLLRLDEGALVPGVFAPRAPVTPSARAQVNASAIAIDTRKVRKLLNPCLQLEY